MTTWRDAAANRAWEKWLCEMEQRERLYPNRENYIWPFGIDEFQDDALELRLMIRPDEVTEWEAVFLDEPPCDDTECQHFHNQLLEVAETLYEAWWHICNDNDDFGWFLVAKAQIIDEYGQAAMNHWDLMNIPGIEELREQVRGSRTS